MIKVRTQPYKNKTLPTAVRTRFQRARLVGVSGMNKSIVEPCHECNEGVLWLRNKAKLNKDQLKNNKCSACSSVVKKQPHKDKYWFGWAMFPSLPIIIFPIITKSFDKYFYYILFLLIIIWVVIAIRKSAKVKKLSEETMYWNTK